MTISALAGRAAPPELLIDVARLEREYYARRPDPEDATQRVAFGTSGHRGSSLAGSFTEAHVAAIAQAIADYRRAHGIDGVLYLGKDTHALSRPAERTVLEVLAANRIDVVMERDDDFTPTPVISHAILTSNARRSSSLADGIVVTPSHNPPQDGGIKYNPPSGGPADTDVTRWIEQRANYYLRGRGREVHRMAFEPALRAPTTHTDDFKRRYIADLGNVIDMDVIRGAKLALAVDPLGGAGAHYWEPINEAHGLAIEVVNATIDPTFAFMSLDHDGVIRMDCSSPHAMARLVSLKNRYRVAFANDPDADRHGIVTPSVGLMNPNHYLAVALRYLLHHRPGWPATAVIGKTFVTSSLIDRVAHESGRHVEEVPVGFKWFVRKLSDGSCCFAGEESAGASFLRRNGAVWTTDKDGLILNLLAAEIAARTGREPGEHYAALAAELGASHYRRIDVPATPRQKERIAVLAPAALATKNLAGEAIAAMLTHAPGNGAAIGGIKVVAASGWFAARPSGTENLYKIYAESLRDDAHLDAIIDEARRIVEAAVGDDRQERR
jgi:phosphoglucomutase